MLKLNFRDDAGAFRMYLIFLDQRTNIMNLLNENQKIDHDQLIQLANKAVT